MSDIFRIFVSSTHDDLQEYREEVCSLIHSLGFYDVAMEQFKAHPTPPINVINKEIDTSDIFIGIYAGKYGSRINTESEKSYIVHEYDYAGSKMPKLIFMADPKKFHFTLDSVDTGINGDLLRQFKERVKKDPITITYFSSLLDLIVSISASLFRLVSHSTYFMKSTHKKKTLILLRQLINDDFYIRLNGIEQNKETVNHEWFIKELSRCNVGKSYIKRKSILDAVSDWLITSDKPLFFITGPSGIGKTNFLVEFTRYLVSDSPGHLKIPVIFFKLGDYNTKEGNFLSNIAKTINNNPRSYFQVSVETIKNLISGGEVLLILDGLDEFIRLYGEEKELEFFLSELKMFFAHAHSRILITCRDHIYKRLMEKRIFDDISTQQIKIPFLSEEEVISAIKVRFGSDSNFYKLINKYQPLIHFAGNPLILELMSQIRIDGWKRLIKNQQPGVLYDLWFQEIITTGSTFDDLLEDDTIEIINEKVGKIAIWMLENKAEMISEKDLNSIDLPKDRLHTLTKQPFGILKQQTRTEWGFVHDSFREFSLAKAISADLTAGKRNVLASISTFSYVGVETVTFLTDILTIDDNFFNRLDMLLAEDITDQNKWNNFVTNCFEIIGLVSSGNYCDKFIKRVCKIINMPMLRCNNKGVTHKTRYNSIRCLERLHRSSPQPYYRYLLEGVHVKKASFQRFCAMAIRGFHAQNPTPGYWWMTYTFESNKSDQPMQKEISEDLLTLLSELPDVKEEDELFIEINITQALIRWLHKDHIDLVKEILKMKQISAPSKGNLFQAFIRFKKPEIFINTSDLFQSMMICRAYISHEVVHSSFVFKNTIIYDFLYSTISGFNDESFENCKIIHEKSSMKKFMKVDF